MLENILDYERDLFLQLNHLQSPFGDQFMWLFSGKIAWIPVSVLFIIILLYKNRSRWKEILLIFAAIALTITLCDQFASGFCKPFFMRFRPTYHPDFMDEVSTIFGYRGGKYGFISSHAANAFGFAILTSLILKYRFYSVMIYIWATVNSYSRIYLGVHFISDIVAGIIAGLILGLITYKIYQFAKRKIVDNNDISVEKSDLARYGGLNIITYLLILTIFVIAIISLLYSLSFIPAITAK